ncbi:CPBP family intramembrane glutamic endopeptidase [Methanothrix sp.]|uniref:CPBP family intramembrane glutamic endopeptidase n=1 Tax=Methanothrix sp. TaxID=90426 RepID=UPI00329A53B3
MKALNAERYYLDLLIPVFLILLAEILIFYGKPEAAMPIHALNLVFLSLSTIFVNNRTYPALMLLPLFRLLNVAMPVFFHLTLYSYVLVYAPMFIPMYMILKERFITPEEAGLTFERFWFFLPVSISMGLALGWGEYMVIKPQMLVVDNDPQQMLILALTMILFVGVVEEFIFRSSLQTVLQERIGLIGGLVLASVIFGFMHSGYHLALELLYVSLAGLAFGVLFWLSKSLPIVSLAHGVTNIALFLIVPLKPEILPYLIIGPLFLFFFYAYALDRIKERIAT